MIWYLIMQISTLIKIKEVRLYINMIFLKTNAFYTPCVTLKPTVCIIYLWSHRRPLYTIMTFCGILNDYKYYKAACADT